MRFPIRRKRTRRAQMVAFGFIGGLAAGLLLWSAQMSRSKRDLFSSNPVKRLAALGYLAARPTVEAASLLQDYCRWEKNPMLRKRAERLLKRMQGSIV